MRLSISVTLLLAAFVLQISGASINQGVEDTGPVTEGGQWDKRKDDVIEFIDEDKDDNVNTIGRDLEKQLIKEGISQKDIAELREIILNIQNSSDEIEVNGWFSKLTDWVKKAAEKVSKGIAIFNAVKEVIALVG